VRPAAPVRPVSQPVICWGLPAMLPLGDGPLRYQTRS
jgi:hypothetical protein